MSQVAIYYYFFLWIVCERKGIFSLKKCHKNPIPSVIDSGVQLFVPWSIFILWATHTHTLGNVPFNENIVKHTLGSKTKCILGSIPKK